MPDFGLTSGPTIDLQPALVGQLVELRPLRPQDWDDLFSVACDPLIWEQHPANDRYKEGVFRVFFREALESEGAFVVLDNSTHQIIGSTRFYGYDAEKSEIEIGWSFLARRYWGGRYNGEMKRLMLAHAFQFVENVVFYVGADNMRSMKAVERIGGIEDGKVSRPDEAGRIVRYLIKGSDWASRHPEERINPNEERLNG
jgi:RimJ/RimL family protein N-acetyltransferase